MEKQVKDFSNNNNKNRHLEGYLKQEQERKANGYYNNSENVKSAENMTDEDFIEEGLFNANFSKILAWTKKMKR